MTQPHLPEAAISRYGEPIRRLLVNAPATVSPTTPRLEDYPFRQTDNVRFADMDINHHVNNAVYATYFEAGRVALTKDNTFGLTPAEASWVLVRLDIHFRAELHWPAVIEMGLGIARIGRTSTSYDQVVFSEGKCIASAKAVTVLVDQRTRKPLPLPPTVIEKLQPWLLPDSLRNA
jgi:acyl-CoA thioester hydrolase